MYKANKEIEERIASLLDADGKSVEFQYEWVEASNSKKVGELVHNRFEVKQKMQVCAFTTNKITKEKFLLKSVVCDTPIECLNEILEYIQKTAHSISTFTVKWVKKENGQLNETNISYFSCHDIIEVVDKFFNGKSVNDYVIYEIKLNPIA